MRYTNLLLLTYLLTAYACSILQPIWLTYNMDWSNPLEAQRYQDSRRHKRHPFG